MCQYLPTGNLKEIEVTERDKDNLLRAILDTKYDDKHGYLKECALEYPQETQGTPNFSHTLGEKQQPK